MYAINIHKKFCTLVLNLGSVYFAAKWIRTVKFFRLRIRTVFDYIYINILWRFCCQKAMTCLLYILRVKLDFFFLHMKIQ